ncbi:hypothetical protein [Caulobacter sp. Root1472]|uniref:hypothetical protein n=1 Tax=Caulobacter sp. Root1472 TaxID=1736470 RepID=UPI0006F9812B|nr:hypothetical protein [Caulobacter sp. Root1472]KQZ18014.1 hypothetical protein ASD47_11230 [Caulobacter sp. Root1472]
MKLAPFARAALALTLVLAPVACAPVAPPPNPAAQVTAASLKTQTLSLLDVAADPYANHAAEVDALTARIDAAASAAAADPLNTFSARQWAVLRDPSRALYGGAITLWRSQGALSPAFRDQKKIQIGRAFDYILCLEANKRQATACGQIEEGGAS